MARAAAIRLAELLESSEDEYLTLGASYILSFIFDLLNLESVEVSLESLTDQELSLIAEECHNSDQILLRKFKKFVRNLFGLCKGTEEHILRLLYVLEEFRRFLDIIRAKPEGSLISGEFSLIVVEQILECGLNMNEESIRVLRRELGCFVILVLRSKPILPSSLEFIKLFCEIIDKNFAIILMAVDKEYFKAFLKKWLILSKKVIENNLLNSLLKFILNENEPQAQRCEIAEILTSKEFIYYFYTSIKNELAFDLTCAAFVSSGNVYNFIGKEYLCWLNDAVHEKDEILKKKYIIFYYTYRIQAGHRNSDILQDVIKEFSYEDTCQLMTQQNVKVIFENIDYIQDPSNIVKECIMIETFNARFGHIAFVFLRAVVEMALVKSPLNLIMINFFITIPDLLRHFNGESFEKSQLLDISLSLSNIWGLNTIIVDSINAFVTNEVNKCQTLAELQRCFKILSRIDRTTFFRMVDITISSYKDSINENRDDFPRIAFKIAGLITNKNFINSTKFSSLLKTTSNLIRENFFINFKEDKTEAYTILIFSQLMNNSINFIFNTFNLDFKQRVCRRLDKMIKLFYIYLEKRLRVEEGHVKHSSYFANKVMYALQNIYLIYQKHTDLDKLLQFKVQFTPDKLQSLILCMVHYLEVTDNLNEQRSIINNFTKFCDSIPQMPFTYLYRLFDLYGKKSYVIELENLMVILRKKKILKEILPSLIFRTTSTDTFQRLNYFLKNLIECPNELILVYSHITLSVLDMIKKKAVAYNYNEHFNRLEILKEIKIFRNVGSNGNVLANARNSLRQLTKWTPVELATQDFFFAGS
ncbi:hypothetical protein ACFFRR_009381 [Megaselia abdita]